MRPIDADVVNQVIIFDKDNEKKSLVNSALNDVYDRTSEDKFPTIEAIPVDELKALRDYLYENDLIFMKGLSKFNELIGKYEIKGE